MKNLSATAILLSVTLCAPASATIIGGTVTGGTALDAGGTFVELTTALSNPFGPSNSVGNNNFQSPNLYGFDEDQHIVLAAPLSVGGGITIPAGSTVASHYIFFDPGPSQHMIGTVDFDSDVLAIITSTRLLAASDFLANTGVNYLNPSHRGLEAGDLVAISGARQILFDTFADSPGDYVRVLTAVSPEVLTAASLEAVVPEPGTLTLLGLSFTGMGLARRRELNSQ